MTDRELLELAAQAAGYTKDRQWGVRYLESAGGSVKVKNSWVKWNPLTDDGDALRLAVKLGLSIQVHHDSCQPFPWLRVVDREQRWTHAMVKEYGADPAASTRRAIVRAAAEIGKQIEKGGAV